MPGWDVLLFRYTIESSEEQCCNANDCSHGKKKCADGIGSKGKRGVFSSDNKYRYSFQFSIC